MKPQSPSNPLPYLTGYSPQLHAQVQALIEQQRLGPYLLNKYPAVHEIRTDRALYEYVTALKNSALRKAEPISKVCYDNKLHVIHNALGTHTYAARLHGKKVKVRHEIRVASVFKQAPLPFLRMIVVHELAHLREKEHNKAFYSLCRNMEPDYHQLELDMRLYLTHLDLFGTLY